MACGIANFHQYGLRNRLVYYDTIFVFWNFILDRGGEGSGGAAAPFRGRRVAVAFVGE